MKFCVSIYRKDTVKLCMNQILLDVEERKFNVVIISANKHHTRNVSLTYVISLYFLVTTPYGLNHMKEIIHIFSHSLFYTRVFVVL
jgi:hypothetical protein